MAALRTHSVGVVVTEQGLADLRGLSPEDRAARIIDQCADPRYRDYLHSYVRTANKRHIRHDLGRCFELHQNLHALRSHAPGFATAANRWCAIRAHHFAGVADYQHNVDIRRIVTSKIDSQWQTRGTRRFSRLALLTRGRRMKCRVHMCIKPHNKSGKRYFFRWTLSAVP